MSEVTVGLSVPTVGSLLDSAFMLGFFLAALFVGSRIVPGRQIDGYDVEGNLHSYRFNGLALFVLCLGVIGIAQFSDWFSLSTLHTHFVSLFIVANVFAFTMSSWLYIASRSQKRQSISFWRGMFFGVDAGPTWLGVHLKFFSYRPSLIGLALLNLSFATVQYETQGELSLAMMLYQGFTLFYVFNYFQFEHGMVHTWDMVSERFGWMLIWGDYVLVPFFYCLVGWWLVDPGFDLSPLAAVVITLLYGFGFWLFRGANQQKHHFKRDPNRKIWGHPAKSLDGRLLLSGFWGIGRHLNYTGEILIYLSFALTAGFSSWVPYLLPAWLATLLIHRSRRDDNRCRAKYGELWQRYTQKVRYSMVPFIY